MTPPSPAPLDRKLLQPPQLAIAQPEPDEPLIAALSELPAPPQPVLLEEIDVAPVIVMPAEETSSVAKRLAQAAEALTQHHQTELAWEQDGAHYSASLVLQPAQHGADFDRVVAEVRAEHRGKLLTTQVMLKRLAFSHYTQMVDRWDPMVQLHDDEIVGRFHVNSRFNLFYDRRTAPTFLGKVTTAASSFNTDANGRRRDAEIFRAGVETRAGRIALPERAQPFDWVPADEAALTHEFSSDARIRFLGDEGYAWGDRKAKSLEQRAPASMHPVYFVAGPGVTLLVEGAVAGKVLVYSPHRIIVEGSLTYVRDPRRVRDSGDFLGLVSERFIEIAPPHVTGPGDLHLHGALFAGRRFLVRGFQHSKSATLRIYGSVAAGSISASEPRYATKIEYDSRFEKVRPPGFPSTDKFAAEDWDGRWQETPARTAAESF